MKIIQTFWTGPKNFVTDNLLNIKAGWLSPEYHWMSWTLSCHQNIKLFKEVELITDEKGETILIDILELPYTKVTTSLEGRLDHYPANLWALAKIYSYSIQQQPFLHIDSDVFLWETPDPNLQDADIISQNLELNLFFYRETLEEINKHFKNVPVIFSKKRYEQKDIYTSNAGLIGGNNLKFIQNYCQIAFDFIDKNIEELNKVNIANLNFIFEQYLLYELSKQENVSISYFMKEIVTSPLFHDFVRFEDFTFVNIIHPVGGFKKLKFICNHLSKKLRMEYPDSYYKIINIMTSENLKIENKIYYYPPIQSDVLNVFHSKRLLDESNIINRGNYENSISTNKNIIEYYERTTASIEYINNNNILKNPETKIDEKKIKESDFSNYINSLMPNGNEKDCLLEIYSLELDKQKLFEKIFSKKSNYFTLYSKDVNKYEFLQKKFGLPENEILEFKLVKEDNVYVRDINWIWQYNHGQEVKTLLKRNLSKEKINSQVALIPSILQLTIDEYYLDTLDMIIIDTCLTVKKINEIMNEIQQYFQNEDINTNYASYKKMIIDSIKRLAYNDILIISEIESF